MVSTAIGRQARRDGLCLSDYIMEPRDHIAIFVVTAGEVWSVLVQREIESWRAPLASTGPFSAGRFGTIPPNAVATGGAGSR